MANKEDESQVAPPSTKPTSIERLRNRCEVIKKKFEAILWVLGVSAAIIGLGWYLLGPRVDEAARRVVLSQQVLDEISSRLRPYAVIEAKPSNSLAVFEYDAGVGDVVDSVYFSQEKNKLNGILTFHMKRFVRLPLVSPLTPGIYVHSFWQTNKFDWAFEIRPSFTTEQLHGMEAPAIESNLSPEKDYRFFVELLTK